MKHLNLARIGLSLLLLGAQPMILANNTNPAPGGGGFCESSPCPGGDTNPTPGGGTTPPTGGGGTTPPASSPNVQYYLSPGFADAPRTGTTDYFGLNTGYGFQSFLQSKSSGDSTPVSSTAVAADYMYSNIPTQAQVFAGAIRDQASAAQKIIVVGHSTGVARVREALQHDGTYANMNKVVGMISIGGANSGAPIAQNGPGLTGQLTTVLGSVIVGFLPASITVVLPGIVLARNFVGNMLNNPTGQDLIPTSNFFQKLNNPAQGTIPANVRTLEIRGQNNNIDSYIGSFWGPRSTQDVAVLRTGAGNTATVAAAVYWIGAFFTFGATIPLAIALTVAAYTFYNLPTIWKQRGVGAEAGDGLLPESSQMIPTNIGGSTRSQVLLPNAVHTGAYGELVVRNYGEYQNAGAMVQGVRTFQSDLTVPQSLLP